MKTKHVWKAYGISNQKGNVAIYSESHMAAILQNGCLETGFYQYLSLQIPLCMKYTHFWKAYGASNHKKTMLPFAPSPIWSLSCISQYGCHETGFRQYHSL